MKMNIRLLLVEDDEDDYILLKDLLNVSRNTKFMIEWVDDFDKGLTALKNNIYDVALVDLFLGKEDGLAFIEKVKNIAPDLPCILITGQGSYEIDYEAMKTGSYDYIPKNKLDLEFLERSIRYSIYRAKTEKELRDLNLSKDKLFSIIAHDLKSPFNSLLGYFDILIEDWETLSIEEKLQYVSSSKDIARNIYDLLDNLLLWSRMQLNAFEPQPGKVNIHNTVNKILKVYKLKAEEKGLELIIDLINDVSVLADENMVLIILKNLVSNSIKFTKSGGKVTISSEKTNGYTNIIIEDTGVGISKEMIDKIMTNLFVESTNGTEGEAGSGLGLMLCKEMIAKNNGNLKIESKQDSGTKFIISLPSA